MSVRIESVEPASPAAKAGLRAGDSLLKIDGNEINDMLDYEFYTARASFELTAECGGQPRTQTVVKEEYQPFGCDFSTYLIDRQHHCCNKCVFCFVDQMPGGMRDTLYFKDDDERLSFLYGNYITLTNLSQKEVDRICRMRISPINISVHTVDPELRVRMMKNPKAGEVLGYLDQFAAAGIQMNFQIVLCPGWNDGERLRESLEKLSAYYPAAQSVAVVPVGLTRYREKLPELRVFDAAGAGETIDLIERVGAYCLEKCGARLVYPSDEFFLLAGREIPSADYYGAFPQIENGVGMWRLLEDEFRQALAGSGPQLWPHRCDIATGEAAYPLLEKLARLCMEKHTLTHIRVHKIKNEFFGGNVSVAGLITGHDLTGQLAGRLASRRVLIPRVMLRAEKDLFLDDVSVGQVEKKLKVRLRVVESDGADLLKAMLGR